MTFKYKAGSVEGCIDNNVYRNFAHDAIPKVSKEGSLVRFVKIGKTDSYGSYQLTLAHNIAGTEIELLDVKFTSHKEVVTLKETVLTEDEIKAAAESVANIAEALEVDNTVASLKISKEASKSLQDIYDEKKTPDHFDDVGLQNTTNRNYWV